MTELPAHADRSTRLGRTLTGWPAATVVLAAFYALMISSLTGKSVTSDEVAHLVGGASYWRFNDYRMNPENGVLPQRLGGLAVLGDRFPPTESKDWQESDEWLVGRAFLYGCGNDPVAMLLRARMACGLLALAMGALVYAWSRRLFGPAGGMVSLLLFALAPIVLANGALVTSDMAASLFFLAACWAFWGLLQNLTPLTLALSCLTAAVLFVTKMQAPIFLPVAAACLLVRLLAPEPLPVSFFSRPRLVARRPLRLLLLLPVLALHAAVALAVIWASYGFRYDMLAHRSSTERPMEVWEVALDYPVPYSCIEQLNLSDPQARALDAFLAPAHGQAELLASPYQRNQLLADAYAKFLDAGVLSPTQRQKLDRLVPRNPSPVVRFFNALRNSRILPEAYLYGHAYVWRHSTGRKAFLNGRISDSGWRTFFPYAFAVKSPLPFLAALLLAAAAALAKTPSPAPTRLRRLASALYATAPLWLFLTVYWPLVIASHINIGHRHLLPAYGPMFVLAGAAAWWLRHRYGRALLAALLALLTLDVLTVWPNYIPYFNQLVGISNGYKHLVDSSVDWGQDAPALARFVADRHAADPARPVYVAYFGNADLATYGLRHATLLPCFPEFNSDKQPSFLLRRTPHQEPPAPLDDPDYFEVRSVVAFQDARPLTVHHLLKRPRLLRLSPGVYCISATMLQPLLYRHYNGPWSADLETIYQSAFWLTREIQHGNEASFLRELAVRNVPDIKTMIDRYETIRLARLCAYLRTRRPAAHINHSILVFELTAAELAVALEGPAPQDPTR